MALKVQVGRFGILDMLRFKNLPKNREKYIRKGANKEVSAHFKINENAAALHPDMQELVITDVIDHDGAGAKTYILQRADNKPAAYFRAGQYLSVSMQFGSSVVTRPYSISCSPLWSKAGRYAITVRKNPSGFAADKLLRSWKVGTTIKTSDPQGNFYYEKFRDAKNVIALAGGSGITPFLSMAYAIRDGIEDFKLTILYGSRDESTILFKKELDGIASVCPKVKVIYVLSESKKDDGYEHGFLTAELIRRYAPENEPYSVFLCGPEAMYRFAEKEIDALGLEHKYIRRELLGVTKEVWEQPGYPEDCRGKSFRLTVRQGGVETVCTANADEPILVAIERAGITAPSRCRSGECGWCRSKLLSGTVYVPEETDGRRYADKQHDYIHPCAAFPTSDVIVEVPGCYIK